MEKVEYPLTTPLWLHKRRKSLWHKLDARALFLLGQAEILKLLLSSLWRQRGEMLAISEHSILSTGLISELIITKAGKSVTQEPVGKQVEECVGTAGDASFWMCWEMGACTI